MRNISLFSNSSLISNYSTVSSGSPLSTSSTVTLLQGLMDGLGWRDQRLEIYQAESDQQLVEQKLQLVIDHYTKEPYSDNRDQLIQVLNETRVLVQKEYDYAIKQRDYYHAHARIEATQKSSISTASYVSQWSQWALDGVKSFFGSTTEQLVEKYATIAQVRQATLSQLSDCLESLTIPTNTSIDSSKEIETHETTEPAQFSELSIQASLCDVPLGVLELSDLTQTTGFMINGATTGDQSGDSVSKAGDSK